MSHQISRARGSDSQHEVVTADYDSRAPGRSGDALCLSRERLKALKWSRPLVLMPIYVSVRRELASVDQARRPALPARYDPVDREHPQIESGVNQAYRPVGNKPAERS